MFTRGPAVLLMYALVIGGLIYAAYLMHMPARWIAVGAIMLVGLGILTATQRTKPRDPQK